MILAAVERTWSPEEIKAFRKSLGLSQQAFSEQLGFGIMAVSRWERGTVIPSKKACEELQGLKRRTDGRQ